MDKRLYPEPHLYNLFNALVYINPFIVGPVINNTYRERDYIYICTYIYR